MGRNRKKSNQQLPKYIYVNRNRYIYRPPGAKDAVIGPASMPLPDVWKAYKELTGEKTHTLQYLVDQYRDSSRFKELKSRKAVSAALDRLLAKKLKTGVFGQVHYKNITTGVIQRYLDRYESVSANREIAYLSSAFRWAITREYVDRNPCKGVYKKKESARKRYVTDKEYAAAYNKADKVVQVAMELAYLCRMRISEVLDTRVKDIEQEGLNTRRLKGSNDALTLWTDRLRKAVDSGLKGCMRVPDMPIVNDSGKPLKRLLENHHNPTT